MKTSESIKEIAAAICKMQAALKPADKDNTNPMYKSRYSDINAIWEALRGPLTSNGLSVWQDAMTSETGVSVITRVVHQSGEWVEFSPFFVPLGIKKDAHGFGSATSYAKRYSLCAALGITSGDEDDDGNAACAPPKKNGDDKKLVDAEVKSFYASQGDDSTQMKGYIADVTTSQGWSEIEAIRRFRDSNGKGKSAFEGWKAKQAQAA
jgi:hypothetical protein